MKTFKLTDEQRDLAAQLTHLQRMTVIGMFNGMARVDAYYAAGGKAKNATTAGAIVSRMLTDAKVTAFRDSLTESAIGSAVMTREEAVARLSEMARIRVTDVARFTKALVGYDLKGRPVYQSTWELKGDEEISPAAAAAIAELTANGQGLKFKLHSPLQALKQLAELCGWEAPKQLEIEDKRPPLMERRAVPLPEGTVDAPAQPTQH